MVLLSHFLALAIDFFHFWVYNIKSSLINIRFEFWIIPEQNRTLKSSNLLVPKVYYFFIVIDF